MKPRIVGTFWPGRPSWARWTISCDCFSTKRAITAVPSWDAALLIALTHWQIEHTKEGTA